MAGRANYALAEVLKAGRSGVNEDLAQGGILVLLDLRLHLSTPWPPPSAPGADPHLRTGDLMRSYRAKVLKNRTGAELTISSSIDYSVYLEFGTRHMAARPHLRPAVLRGSMTIARCVANGIEQRERRMARALGGRG